MHFVKECECRESIEESGFENQGRSSVGSSDFIFSSSSGNAIIDESS